MATRTFAPVPEPMFMVKTDVLSFRTRRRTQFVDVTETVLERVRRAGVGQGLVCLQTRHTTTAVVVNESEPLLLSDMRRVLERLAPRRRHYAHNDLARRAQVAPDESRNGDAHCKALLLPTSVNLVVGDGQVQLGRWQRVFLVELDGPRARELALAVLGTAFSLPAAPPRAILTPPCDEPRSFPPSAPPRGTPKSSRG